MGININHSKNTIKTEDKLTIEATNNVSVTNNRITDVQDPIDPQDAVTKKYLEDAIATLALLTPPTPPTINTKSFGLIGDAPYRITDHFQTDITVSNIQQATPGTMVPNVLRSTSFQTTTIEEIGPGDSGTLSLVRNGITTASVTFDANVNNGVYTDSDTLVISNNIDYGLITSNPLGFSQAYNVAANSSSGTVPSGWNQIHFAQDGNETDKYTWYADLSNPGAPTITNVSVTPDAIESLAYSSTIPHYTSAQVFNVAFELGKLSGDFYPATDTFFTASTTPAGSGLNSLGNLTYSHFGIVTPIPRNYLDTTTLPVSTTTTVKTGTGISQAGVGPNAVVDNSYQTTVQNFGPSEILLRLSQSATNVINEWSIPVINVGFGSGNAVRNEIVNGDTPTNTAFTTFQSQTSVLNNWDATVVGGILSHDTTNYSTGYLPVGPDLSVGRSGSQYFEVKFNRSAVSKFAVRWSGKASGCWIKLPGTSIDSTSTLNGWLDTTVPYDGSGVPGANTGAGGNGSNGCSLGGAFTVGSTVSNQNVDITFGTESSSNATGNLIVVRFKLEAGDSITNLSFVAAS